jgi:HAD superfamily hydrolase (TIGR01549 family)
MKYSAVVFDWDGTLGMTLHLWFDAYKSELKNLGIELSDQVIIDDFFYEHEKIEGKYPAVKYDPFIKNIRAYMISHIASMKLYEGVHEMLEKLQLEGITLTLVSSSPRKLLEEVLELHGLTKFFTAISGFDDIMKHKPDPEPFLYIMEVAKLDPDTTVILGDSPHDVTAAKAAGVDSCLFLPPDNKIFYNFDELKKTDPTYSVESLEEFSTLIINT